MKIPTTKFVFINRKTLVRHHVEYMTDAELEKRNDWVRRNIGEHMVYVTEEYYEELLNPPPSSSSSEESY